MGNVVAARSALAGEAPPATELMTADDSWLSAHDVRWWAGARSLPLWLPAEAGGFARRSGASFRDLGGLRTTLRETVTKVLEDEFVRGVARERRSGLGVADEIELLRDLAAGAVSRG